MSTAYELDDPRPIAVEAPYTFFLPSEEEKEAAGVGDYVQLIFLHLVDWTEYRVERMWVKITKTHGEKLAGDLANTPSEPNSGIKCGDEVQFERFNIINIEWETPAKAPNVQLRRQYWDRCLVDDCVLEGEQPPEYLYKEAPDPDFADDRFKDSGWRIRGKQGECTDDQMDKRTFRYVALGAVLNCDDSWLHLIDEPVGSAFLRNFETGEYERC